jgi:hypothetical protein
MLFREWGGSTVDEDDGDEAFLSRPEIPEIHPN